MVCRVSKYDSKFRDRTGAYIKNEWTSYSDIGSNFDDGILTEKEYLIVEKNYIDFVCEMLKNLKINELDLKKQEPKNKYNISKIKVDEEFFKQILRESLREEFWCEFHCEKLKFWVGYDYYLNIDSKADITEILEKIATKYQLFLEKF